MSSNRKRGSTAIVLLLVFATVQVYVGLSFAAPRTAVSLEAAPAPAQQPMASLTTQGNRPITVNGVATMSGATVVSGASIETPPGVGATVNLGALGSLQIDPNTKLTLEFQNGSVKVMVLQGCVTLNTKKGTSGEVDTSQGVAGKTDAAKAGAIKVCAPGSVPPPSITGGGGGAGSGISTSAALAIIGGTEGVAALALALGGRGSNPSGSTP